MLTTGQIVFAVGLAGLAASLIATIVTTKTDQKHERERREDIWREYKGQPVPVHRPCRGRARPARNFAVATPLIFALEGS